MRKISLGLGLALCASLAAASGVFRVQKIDRVEFSTGVTVFHDDQYGATCWIYKTEPSVNYSQGGGISCIPDSQLERRP